MRMEMRRNKTTRNIIPEFMAKNPKDIFEILLPIRLMLNSDDYANNKFKVIIKNHEKNYTFSYNLSPELLFTHFPVRKYFLNGCKATKIINSEIQRFNFNINTYMINKDNTFKLEELIEESEIFYLFDKLLNPYLKYAKQIYCYYICFDNFNAIIPHYAVAIYYYFRFTSLREAVFRDQLDNLHQGAYIENNKATIILKQKKSDEDAAHIHRFVCQEYSKKCFEDISAYIQSYLNYMKNKTVKNMPIKAKFPIMDEFRIESRASLINDKHGKLTYFIHEITNDYSSLGFTKLLKIIQKDNIIKSMKDFSSLPTVKSMMPHDTTEILKEAPATRAYFYNKIYKDKNFSCGSLCGIEVKEKEETIDSIIKILQIKEYALNITSIDQSTTESQIEGVNTIRKVVLGTKLKEYIMKKIDDERIKNFEAFNKYIDFLKAECNIEGLVKNNVQKLPQIVDQKTGKVKPKCKLNQREKEYITATFKYNNLHIGLLDIENGENSSASTWVIISNNPVTQNTFDFFINLYFIDDMTIENIKNIYKNTPLKFVTKNHEHTKDLSKRDLIRWASGLLSKV